MLLRHRSIIALLSIALLAIDAVVFALGHSHAHGLSPHGRDRHCCHHGATNHHEEEHSLPADPAPAPDDDCSLCRHFSQPVLPALINVELTGGACIESVETLLTPLTVAVGKLPHPARGPPALCA